MSRLVRRVAVFALCVAAAGCQGSPFDGSRPRPRTPSFVGAGVDVDASVDAGAPTDAREAPEELAADVAGRWAMFHFEDPIAVELQQTGTTLRGLGCAAGIPETGRPLDVWGTLCGDVLGQVNGRHVRFSFGQPPQPVYDRMDAVVSADGRRMTGRRVSASGEPSAWVFAWLRIASTEPWLKVAPAPALNAAVTEREQSVTLDPEGPAPDVELVADHHWLSLLVQRGGALVTGSLGAFCADEMTWNAATQTLVAGPVPATAPGLPIKLVIAFDAKTLLGVEATMPSGLVHRFTPRAP